MSGMFPTIPGLDIAVKRTEIYSTVVQVAPSGKEARAAFTATPRYRYELTFNFLRQAGFNGMVTDELATLKNFFDTQKGAWDTFSFTDPVDSVVRTCRFEQDTLDLTRIVAKAWDGGTVNLISVK